MEFDYAIFSDGLAAVLIAHFSCLLAGLCGVVAVNWLVLRD